MFYESLRLWGGFDFNQANIRGGSAKEGRHVRGGSELGSYEDFDERMEESGSGRFNLLCSSVF